MFSFLTTTTWIFSIVLTIYVFYYFIITLFSFKRITNKKQYAPKNRFAIIIAARNEECVIGCLVESLLSQNYPKELFDVIVVPNNCTDNTRDAAAQKGAKIIDCTIPVKSKGEVLSFALEKIWHSKEHYDALCVFDADNLVHPNFLLEMNNALCSGATVAQGYRDSKNPYDSAISSCYSIYYWMINRFYNQSRSALGLSAMINGSGFMVRMDLLKKLGGWRTVTMTEDIEFTTQCILQGEKVAWVPDAIIYDEQPLTFAQSWIQRKRWSTGLLQGFSVYFSKLFKSLIKEKRLNCADHMMFFLAPGIQLIYLLSFLMGLVLNLFYINHQMFPQNTIFYKILVSLDCSYLTTVAMAILIILIEKKKNRKLIKGIVGYWLFIMSWIPINILCFFKKSLVWNEIKHTRSIELKEIAYAEKSIE
ncbi:glycosyltransferase family 2 protein [Oscillospiraceae bacterium PP1C4]